MVINSHIQITQGILRGFAFKSEDGFKVHYLDLKDYEIKEEKIKSLGSEKFYYNDDNEKYLGKIEKRFGEVAAKIKKFGKGRVDDISLNKVECEDIKNFFEYTFIRSKKTLEDVNKYSVMSKIIGDISHNCLIDMTKEDKKVLSFFKDFKINIIKNNTQIGFIVPSNEYYMLKKRNYEREMYIMPLNKNIGIAMIYKKDYDKFINKEKLQYLSIKDEKTILNLNELALTFEKSSNNQFIVGEVSELIRLKNLN